MVSTDVLLTVVIVLVFFGSRMNLTWFNLYVLCNKFCKGFCVVFTFLIFQNTCFSNLNLWRVLLCLLRREVKALLKDGLVYKLLLVSRRVRVFLSAEKVWYGFS